MTSPRTLSRSTVVALRLLGVEIAQARRERMWKAEELAERAGVSLPTLRKVERGDPSVSIGTAFEIATLVGVPLWGGHQQTTSRLTVASDRLSLLAKRVRGPVKKVNDDF